MAARRPSNEGSDRPGKEQMLLWRELVCWPAGIETKNVTGQWMPGNGINDVEGPVAALDPAWMNGSSMRFRESRRAP